MTYSEVTSIWGFNECRGSGFGLSVGIRESEFRLQDSGFGIWDLGFGIRGPDP